MYTTIIKKNLTIGLSKPAKLKNSRYFLKSPRIVNHNKFMYERNLKMFYFKSNLSHLDTCMHFKLIAD